MSITADTRTYLLTQSSVTDLVGNRIYFDNLPQSATLPAVVLEMSDSFPASRHLTATGTLDRSALTAYCYASTRTSASSLGDAVYAAIEFKAGTWGSSTVSRALVDNTYDGTDQPRDNSAAWRYIRAIFFAVWHT